MSWITDKRLPGYLKFNFETMKMQQTLRTSVGESTWDLKRDVSGQWYERSNQFPEDGWSVFHASVVLEDVYREHKGLPEIARKRPLVLTVRSTCECTNSELKIINDRMRVLEGIFQREMNRQIEIILGVKKCRG